MEYHSGNATRAGFSETEQFDPYELLIDKLNLLRKGRDPDSFPFIEVLWSYRKHGKHFVSPDLIAALRRVREALTESSADVHPFLHSFLNVMLDKHDGRYDYRSYLALELLDFPNEVTLVHHPRDYQDELDRSILLLATDIVDPYAHMQSAMALVRTVDATMSEEKKLRLQLSHVLVYVVHDEYMFIRILQCFETVFAWLCAQLKAAIHACASDIHT